MSRPYGSLFSRAGSEQCNDRSQLLDYFLKFFHGCSPLGVCKSNTVEGRGTAVR